MPVLKLSTKSTMKRVSETTLKMIQEGVFSSLKKVMPTGRMIKFPIINISINRYSHANYPLHRAASRGRCAGFIPVVLYVEVVVVVSGPVATTTTPVPVEEVEVRAARVAKPTERGGGGRGTGVVGVPAVRKGRPSLVEELMMEGRRPRPPKEALSAPKEPLSPSSEAWDSL
ncbi:hypothetical protein EYF80_008649 [Liparis tanakae]|uniref:Uncharacterized protein n=1 Tax=Liparis tanakae TaxID=230148 RepID=A0A4Z2IUU2_9TELE|nr:hypothetical protein EYF80_008649 [Liparis tanakae]